MTHSVGKIHVALKKLQYVVIVNFPITYIRTRHE